MSSGIDFVILWVDGNDPEWIEEKSLYFPKKTDDAARFRDWGLLRYWFRGVEKYSPWVDRVFFITWGHLPSWLNTNCEKLRIVRHDDYIPKKYLPTFNSNTIELNLHRIESLSENFVLFNDDMFLVDKTTSKDFFKHDKPCTSAILSPYRALYGDWFFTPMANIAVINKYYSVYDSVKRNPGKWLSLIYGKNLIRTLSMLPYSHYFGIWEDHLPTSHKKSTFYEVWSLEEELLDLTCTSKIRNTTLLSHWLMKYWQIAKGDFEPRSTKIGTTIQLHTDAEKGVNRAQEIIKHNSKKLLCINDATVVGNIEEYSLCIRNAFEEVLPNKSKFEQ